MVVDDVLFYFFYKFRCILLPTTSVSKEYNANIYSFKSNYLTFDKI